MTIKKKILFWFLIPSIIITTFTSALCYYYIQKTVKQNIFDQLDIAADELQKHIQFFLKEKMGRTVDYGSDGFIRMCTEEITMKESRRKHYISILKDHLITNKKSLDPNILEILVVDFNGKVIASTDENRIGENVSKEKYFTEVEHLNAFVGDLHYDNLLKEIVINFSTVLFSKIGLESIGVIINRIKVGRKDGGKTGSTLVQQDYERYYSQLVAVNKARIMDFSSDGFIRDCAEEVAKRDDRTQFYVERLNMHLALNKQPLDPDIIAILVVDFDGKVISSTEIGQIGLDVSDEKSIMKAMKRGSHISDLRYTPGLRQNTYFDVARLLLSKEEQNPIGVIVNRYKGDTLGTITRSGSAGELGQIKKLGGMEKTCKLYIINRDKLMITESRFAEDTIFQQVIDTEGVRAAFDNGAGVTGIYLDYRGIPVLGASRYIEDMDWVVLAEKDVSEAFAPVVRLRNFIIIMGITGIVVIVAVAIFISSGIAKPIKKLTEGTRRIASGDLEHSITIDRRNTEIKELGESFNSMMGKLKKSKEINNQLFLQVKRGRDEWQKTFDAITDIITVHDKDFRILRANKIFYEKFGIDKKKLNEKKCYEIFHSTDKPWNNCPLERSVTSLKPECEEVNDPNMGGSYLISTYPLEKDEKEEAYSFVHLAKDITLQRRLQRQLVEKANELENANRELEDFVYIVSHDLKEPLFAIEGYTSRLHKACKDAIGDKEKYYINRIKSNLKKMSQNISEIMEVLKIGRIAYEFKKNDIGVIVKDTVKMLENRIKAKKIDVSIQDNLPVVLCDRERLRDVFLNLLTNAIKFMGSANFHKSPLPPFRCDSENRLSNSANCRKGGSKGRLRKIKIGCNKNGEICKFFVEDTGIGILPEHQKHIFKIFRRLKDVDAEGSGVGLAIVKKIIELHKGKVWVESPFNGGRGSRFCFTVPMSRDIPDQQDIKS
ncbi:MAG: ATP-binding protein [Candidatus Scalinduaceae bacterium]